MIHSEAGRIFIALGIGKCNLSSDKKREAAQRDVAKIGPLGLLFLASLLD